MIAIPIDSAIPGTKSSQNFTSAEMFALKSDNIKYPFIHLNAGSGDVMETANYLKKEGVDTVVFSHMNENLYKALDESDINVYYIGKESLKVYEILDGLKEEQFLKVEADEAKKYLD
jgi:predicted Fe-Mo cluster-binding NifX family protein